MNPLSLVSGTWPSGPGRDHHRPGHRDHVPPHGRHHGRAGGPQAPRAVPGHRDLPLRRSRPPSGPPSSPPSTSPSPSASSASRGGSTRSMSLPARVYPSAGSSPPSAASLPPRVQVKTAAQQASTATSDVGQQFALLRYALLAFGAIALLVGSFVIFNTLSITVAQRTRQLATLRTLGASRRQVLASVLAEGTIIGAASSVARPRGRDRLRQGPQRPAGRLRHPVARRRHRAHLADRRHQPHRRDRRHPRRQRGPGAAGHADRAHRRDPGGDGTASGDRGCAASP